MKGLSYSIRELNPVVARIQGVDAPDKRKAGSILSSWPIQDDTILRAMPKPTSNTRTVVQS
jgi:hypothetical protein